MHFVKYITREDFNKTDFVQMLKEKMNVRAKEVDDGIILDLDAFNDVPTYLMPYWARLNADAINSKYHTKEVIKEDWPTNNDSLHYILIIQENEKEFKVMKSHETENLKVIIKEFRKLYSKRYRKAAFIIKDKRTNEAVYIDKR